MSVTVRDIQAFRERGERFAMLTAYDALSAHLLDEAGDPLLHGADVVEGGSYDDDTSVTSGSQRTHRQARSAEQRAQQRRRPEVADLDAQNLVKYYPIKAPWEK